MDFYLEGKQYQTNEVRKQPQNRIMQSKSFGIPRQLIKKEDLILFSRPLVDGGWGKVLVPLHFLFSVF